jgi:hypothetical protein
MLEQALLSTLIGGLTAIEHLRLGETAEDLYTFQHAEEFLQLVLTKPRLTSLQFPHVVYISHQFALTFKPRADFVTDTYENNNSSVMQAKRTCCMAMYRIAEKPSYGWYKLSPKHRNKRSCWRIHQPRVLTIKQGFDTTTWFHAYILN